MGEPSDAHGHTAQDPGPGGQLPDPARDPGPRPGFCTCAAFPTLEPPVPPGVRPWPAGCPRPGDLSEARAREWRAPIRKPLSAGSSWLGAWRPAPGPGAFTPPSLGRPGGQDAVITESTQGRREDDESTPETALRKPRCRADVGDHACDWAVAMVTGAPCLVSKYP